MADSTAASHDRTPLLWIAGTIGTAIVAFSSLAYFTDTKDRSYSYNHTGIPEVELGIKNASIYNLPLVIAKDINYAEGYCKHQTYMCIYVDMDFKHHHDPSEKGYVPLLYVAGFLSLALAGYHTFRIFRPATAVVKWCTALYCSIFVVVWVSIAFAISAILTSFCFEVACPTNATGHSWKKETKAEEVFISIGLAMAFLAVAGLHWNHSRMSVKTLTNRDTLVQSYGAWLSTLRFILAFALIFQFGLAVQYMSHELEKDPVCKRNDDLNSTAYWIFTVAIGIGFAWGLIVFFQFVDSSILYMSANGQGLLPEWYHTGTTKISAVLIAGRFILLGSSIILLVNARISEPYCEGLVQQVQELVDEKDRWQMFAIILVESVVVLTVASTVRVADLATGNTLLF